jgi:disulfide bond formation protein DsbB
MKSRDQTMTAALQRQQPAVAEPRWVFLFAAWVVALTSALAALFIGEVMGQIPCNLCWHQRVFMFPLAVILGIAAIRNDFGSRIYALPLAAIGGLIAGFHSLLYVGIIPRAIEPCGAGPSCSSAAMTILGGVPIPYLSVAAFLIIILLLVGMSPRRPL